MSTSPAARRMPVLFVGHGSPMNALEDNKWSRGFRALAGLMPPPKAVLAISAHWFVPGTFTTGNARPETIHDFGGFPEELYQQQYPAAGDPALAQRVVALLGERAAVRSDWGLDHGTWSVLHHMIPKADIPVVQLSIDQRLTGAQHLALGQRLAPLRDEGVLILGSGNITHNLRHAFTSFRQGETGTPEWAATFDADTARAAGQHDGAFLSRALESQSGRMSHPSPDHFLPLLYTAGASGVDDAVTFPIDGFDLNSLSMRSILWSAPA